MDTRRRWASALVTISLVLTIGVAPAMATRGIQSGSGTRASQPAVPSASEPRLRKLWVVPVYWDARPDESVRNDLADGAADVANYLNSQAGGRTVFAVGGVRPFLHLDSRLGRSCDEGTWGYLASRSLGAAFDFEKDGLLLWSPKACGGGISHDRSNRWALLSSDPSQLVHPYALLEAFAVGMTISGRGSVLTCEDAAGTPTVASGTCRMVGVDPFTLVDGTEGLPGSSRAASGLAHDTQWRVAPTSGQYSLRPRGSDTGTILLEVPWKGTEEYGVPSLQLEYVSGTQRDSTLATNPADFGLAGGGGVGVTVSLCGDSPWVKIERDSLIPTGRCPLIDMRPALRAQGFDPTLHLGDSWTTPDGSLTLSVTSMTPDEVGIHVQRAPDVVAPFKFDFDHTVLRKNGAWRTVVFAWGNGLDWFPDDVALQRHEVLIDGRLRATLNDQQYGVHARVPSSWKGQLTRGRHTVMVTSVDYAGNQTSIRKVITLK